MKHHGSETKRFDVLVLGGGHAGCEAAAAAWRMGAKVGLVTFRRGDLGMMSCNPAIGGVGKGHLVREIDALDGIMGRAADAAGIQFRLLNRSKGPAVRGPRAQADRVLYRRAVQQMMADMVGLEVIEGEVQGISVGADGWTNGLELADGRSLGARCVVVTTGTFLGGRLFVGGEIVAGGRVGAGAATALARWFRDRGFRTGRLKTGTPPRLDGSTIDWQGVDVQYGDEKPVFFSALSGGGMAPQVRCHVTGTTAATHRLVMENLKSSAMYSGAFDGSGPRYCPSIEDKVVRFPERDRHQIFLEPEGLGDQTIYPNGISTSLPAAVQRAFIQTIPGLEKARIMQLGYAVEYDFVDPRGLGRDFQTRAVPGLFLAGQINGTTGYEEAAGQGLLAGTNAVQAAGGGGPFVVDRGEGYLGVLADDLVVRGVDEPYRMFTARAEFRLRLGIDSADTRLTPAGLNVGVVGRERAKRFRATEKALTTVRQKMKVARVVVDAGKGDRVTAWEAVKRPDFGMEDLRSQVATVQGVEDGVLRRAVDEAFYEGYLRRQDSDLAAFRRNEQLRLPQSLRYDEVVGLSREVAERLELSRPETLGQAARVSGVTPAGVSVLLRHVVAAA